MTPAALLGLLLETCPDMPPEAMARLVETLAPHPELVLALAELLKTGSLPKALPVRPLLEAGLDPFTALVVLAIQTDEPELAADIVRQARAAVLRGNRG